MSQQSNDKITAKEREKNQNCSVDAVFSKSFRQLFVREWLKTLPQFFDTTLLRQKLPFLGFEFWCTALLTPYHRWMTRPPLWKRKETIK